MSVKRRKSVLFCKVIFFFPPSTYRNLQSQKGLCVTENSSRTQRVPFGGCARCVQLGGTAGCQSLYLLLGNVKLGGFLGLSRQRPPNSILGRVNSRELAKGGWNSRKPLPLKRNPGSYGAGESLAVVVPER